MEVYIFDQQKFFNQGVGVLFITVYSCFDKGCPTKALKRTATMPIGIMGRKSLALID